MCSWEITAWNRIGGCGQRAAGEAASPQRWGRTGKAHKERKRKMLSSSVIHGWRTFLQVSSPACQSTTWWTFPAALLWIFIFYSYILGMGAGGEARTMKVIFINDLLLFFCCFLEGSPALKPCFGYFFLQSNIKEGGEITVALHQLVIL